jgi:hypothetical protein
MHTAPDAKVQIVDLADGKIYWAQHRRDAWRKLEPLKDFKTGAVQWRENGETIQQPAGWIPRQR